MLLVYIAEAHAADQWPINSMAYSGPGNTVWQPASLKDRCDIVRRMLHAMPCIRDVPVLVDGIDDAFLSAFAAWPLRIWGVHQAVVEVVGQPQDASFDLAPFREWLLTKTAPQTST